ncbi:hypothetical protein T10_7773 [Trichinella papuae]|uniref:Uncharacterized protein n=1 Tax=Trichinella papuae TaxID=268474 RepID=A0A0V1MIP5_9BILA|nr:hypothetical protein T10_7773 [Trichinella papuae]
MDFAVLGTQKSSFAIFAFSYKHRYLSIGESVVQRNLRILNILQTQPIQLRCSKGNSLGTITLTILINFMELFSNLQEVDIAGPIY